VTVKQVWLILCVHDIMWWTSIYEPTILKMHITNTTAPSVAASFSFRSGSEFSF
jgi:hypothetical protein